MFQPDDGGGRPGRCHRKGMNRKALIRMREHPFHSRVISTWCQQSRQKEPNGKSASQASQSRWLTPTTFDGGTRQITLLANVPNSEDHKTTFVLYSPRRRRKKQTKPRKREWHSCNNSPIPMTEAVPPAIV